MGGWQRAAAERFLGRLSPHQPSKKILKSEGPSHPPPSPASSARSIITLLRNAPHRPAPGPTGGRKSVHEHDFRSKEFFFSSDLVRRRPFEAQGIPLPVGDELLQGVGRPRVGQGDVPDRRRREEVPRLLRRDPDRLGRSRERQGERRRQGAGRPPRPRLDALSDASDRPARRDARAPHAGPADRSRTSRARARRPTRRPSSSRRSTRDGSRSSRCATATPAARSSPSPSRRRPRGAPCRRRSRASSTRRRRTATAARSSSPTRRAGSPARRTSRS